MNGFPNYEAAVYAFMNPSRPSAGQANLPTPAHRLFEKGDRVQWPSSHGRWWHRFEHGRVINWGYIPLQEAGGDWCYIIAMEEKRLFKQEVRYAVVWQTNLAKPSTQPFIGKLTQYLRRMR